MKIVITEINWPIGIELLQAEGWDVVYDPDLWKDRAKLQTELKSADAIIVRNQTRVDAELLNWKHRLKVIGRLGVGLDNIDLIEAGRLNIPVIYGKNANATSVAEYVIAAMFASSRLLNEANLSVRAGEWNRKKFTGTEVCGKVLGLIGVGEIGHRVAVRANALGLRVIGYDPYVAPYDFPVAETGIKLASFEQVMAESDFISLHVPLTEHTRHLVDMHAIKKMKQSAIIINSARGGIIHETDLHEALQKGMLAGAVLDVLEQEPPPADHPLLHNEKCLLTPHIAGLTEQSQARVSRLVSAEVANVLHGRKSLCQVQIRK